MSREERQQGKKQSMPFLDTKEIEIYRTLTIKDYDTDGMVIEDRIRTHEMFHGRPRKDHVIIDYGDVEKVYGQVQLLFKVVYLVDILELCLAQRFLPIDAPHNTGLEMVRPALESRYSGMIISFVHNIERSVWIVPDFATPKNNPASSSQATRVSLYFYERYLVNSDSDRFSFINSRGRISSLDKKEYIGWKTAIHSSEDVSAEDVEMSDIPSRNAVTDIDSDTHPQHSES